MRCIYAVRIYTYGIGGGQVALGSRLLMCCYCVANVLRMCC
jgi:hypothetical protein